jgi:hypothetical protein
VALRSKGGSRAAALLQKRLREMSDEKLLQFGRDAKYMCSPDANLGRPPREVFVIQLKEAKLEWQRRHMADKS